ncbi:MAG: tRNA epoxyqueuosine(34) reductase QueG, partial [Bacillota bacterium]
MFITKETLTYAALQAGVTEIGATTADPLTEMKEKLERRQTEKRITTFEEQDPAKRLSPTGLLDNCRSIITLAVPYTPPGEQFPAENSNLYGRVARCARSIDYHLIIEKKTSEVITALKDVTGANFNYRILSDRSPLLERELARKSGLGRVGENCTLINSRYGSYVALATVLIDEYIEPGLVNSEKCLNCGRCRKACPTGALTEPYIINPHRCISYLTQAGGPVPLEFRPLLANHIYGCDLCQEACPLNEQVELSPYPEAAFTFFPA